MLTSNIPVGSFQTLTLFQDNDDPLVFRTRAGQVSREELERAEYVRVFSVKHERRTGFLYQCGRVHSGPAQEITTPEVAVARARDLRDFLIKMKRM